MPRSDRPKPAAGPKPVYDPLAKLKAKELARRLSEMSPDPAEPIIPDREGGDTERDDKRELEAVRRALKESDQRVKDVSGEGFHATIVFLSENQLKAFLQATGWVSIEHGRYIDGLALAERLGVPLPPVRPTSIRPGQGDKKAVRDVGLIDGYPE